MPIRVFLWVMALVPSLTPEGKEEARPGLGNRPCGLGC